MLIVNEKGQMVNSRKPGKFLRPLEVDAQIVDRTWVFKFKDKQIVVLRVDPNECDFEVEKIDGLYVVTLRATDLIGDTKYTSNYVFNEPLEVVGLVSDLGVDYYTFAQALKYEPQQLLILERK